MREHQVTVPLTAEQRAFLEACARREDRSLAGQVRHLVAEAARRQADSREAA
jgi:hypothetical protein